MSLYFLGRGRSGMVVSGYFTHHLNFVDLCNANTTDFAIHEHLTGSAFAYPTFEGAVAVMKTVAMNRVSRLMERSGDCKALITLDKFTFVQKFNFLNHRYF
jgi:hypothetical protein